MFDSGRNQLSRRDFLKTVVLWAGGLIAGFIGIPSVAYLMWPAMISSEDESVIDLGPLEHYPVGVPTRFDFTRTRVNGWERTAVNHGLYIVRTSEAEVRVFSDICTHLGCRVNWHPDIGHYVSPCHDGHFDRLGKVLSGPPPRPLDEYPARTEGGRLLISLPPVRRSA